MAAHANPVDWFEIPVENMARAKAFYGGVLGVEVTEMEMGPHQMGWFPMEMGAPGAAGTLVRGEGYRPSRDGTLVYLHVASIDDTLAAIESHGGTPLLPRTSIGQYGFVAQFVDSEGNRIALHESTCDA
ncbi:MAG: VOC family protein [Planctomycetales bacterium]|nr:VOC family protein [Planctomycetales bacterium]